MEERLGTILFDGRMYNLDHMSSQEIKDLYHKVDEKKNQLMEQIKRLAREEEGEAYAK